MDLQQAITEIKNGNTKIYLSEEYLPNLEYIGEDLNIKQKPQYCGKYFILTYKRKTVYIYVS